MQYELRSTTKLGLVSVGQIFQKTEPCQFYGKEEAGGVKIITEDKVDFRKIPTFSSKSGGKYVSDLINLNSFFRGKNDLMFMTTEKQNEWFVRLATPSEIKKFRWNKYQGNIHDRYFYFTDEQFSQLTDGRDDVLFRIMYINDEDCGVYITVKAVEDKGQTSTLQDVLTSQDLCYHTYIKPERFFFLPESFKRAGNIMSRDNLRTWFRNDGSLVIAANDCTCDCGNRFVKYRNGGSCPVCAGGYLDRKLAKEKAKQTALIERISRLSKEIKRQTQGFNSPEWTDID